MALICLIVIPSTITHASSTTVAGLTVSPAIQQVDLLKDQTNSSFTTQVTNNNAATITVRLSTNDFTALNTTGQVAFYNNSPNPNPHGLAQWMKPAFTHFDLLPGATELIPVSIINVGTLAPGGHYGAIIYRVVVKGSSTTGNSVGSNEEVSTLVFLTTYNKGIQAVTMGNPHLNSLMLHIPTAVNLVLTNTGNTQTAPRGVVTVSTSSGKEIARGIIDIDSGLVLPSTSRLYAVALRAESGRNLPGLYKIHIVYRADGNTTSSTYTKTFILINEPIVVAAAVILLILTVFLIRKTTPYKKYRRTRA